MTHIKCSLERMNVSERCFALYATVFQLNLFIKLEFILFNFVFEKKKYFSKFSNTFICIFITFNRVVQIFVFSFIVNLFVTKVFCKENLKG